MKYIATGALVLLVFDALTMQIGWNAPPLAVGCLAALGLIAALLAIAEEIRKAT